MNTPENNENTPNIDENASEIPVIESTDQKKPTNTTANIKLNRRSVTNYISVLFGAAFFLLLLTFLMEQRASQSIIDGLTTSISNLKESNSAMESVDALYQKNSELNEDVIAFQASVKALEEEVAALESQLETSTTELQAFTDSQAAMDWFWQLNEAFVRGRNSTARTLIREMETLELVDDLPIESVTDNHRFSPADRYAEIYNILF